MLLQFLAATLFHVMSWQFLAAILFHVMLWQFLTETLFHVMLWQFLAAILNHVMLWQFIGIHLLHIIIAINFPNMTNIYNANYNFPGWSFSLCILVSLNNDKIEILALSTPNHKDTSNVSENGY